MTLKNLTYSEEPLDEGSVKQLATAVNTNPSLANVKTLDSTVAGMGAIITAWGIQSVFDEYDPFMSNRITKGGHAEGRSLQGAEEREPMDADATPTIDYFLRPNGDKYYHRKWGEKFSDVEVLRKAREAMHFPLLYGPPGTGKTAMTEAAYGDELYTVLGTGDTEVSDLIGGYIQNDLGTFEWVDGPLVKAMEEGKPILLDEIGIIDPKVLTVVYGAMDGRRELPVTANPTRGTVRAKDGFFVIGATNPNAPGVRLSEALLSRFTLHVEVTTDYALALRLGVNKHIVHAAKNMDGRVRGAGDIEWAPQFRELLAFRDVSRDFGEKFAIENLIASAPEIARGDIVSVIQRGPLNATYNPAQIK